MENKGRGIFYGVIGVATLIVAIIGATFAYFSATISSATDAIKTGSTEVKLKLTPDIRGYKTNLVPVDETTTEFATKGYVGYDGCVDDNGNNFCSIFEFTLKNESATAYQTVYGTLNVATNTFPSNAADAFSSTTNKTLDEALYQSKSNLAFAIFKGSADKIETWDVDGTAVTTPDASDDNAVLYHIVGEEGDMVQARTPIPTKTADNTVSFDLDTLQQTLAPTQEVTYTILMWLHDTEYAQNGDMNQSFAAGLTFDTGSDGGVTAVLSTTGPKQ